MKDNIDKHIDKKIKDSFEQLQKKAPSHLWDKISTGLEEQEALDEQLDQKVKKGFEQQKAVLPVGLWDSIADGLETEEVLDETIDQKVKEGFEQQTVHKAPASVWRNVRRQLNIDKTWTKVQQELDVRPVVTDWRKRMLQFVSAAAVLLLFLRTCDLDTFQPQPTVHTNDFPPQTITSPHSTQKETHLAKTNSKAASTDNSSATHKTQEKKQAGNMATANISSTNNSRNNAHTPDETATANQQMAENEIIVVDNVVASNNEDENKPIALSNEAATTPLVATKQQGITNVEKNNKKNTSVPTNAKKASSNDRKEAKSQGHRNEEDAATKEISTNSYFANQQLQPILIPSIENNLLDNQLQKPETIRLIDEPILKNEKKNPIAGRLQAGAFVVVNSTMLLNEETREGFSAPDKVKNYFGLAFNYGLWAAYRIGRRHSVVAEFSFNADNKQSYGIWDNGRFFIKEWVMKYNRFSLAYKHDLFMTKGKALDTRINAQLGVYLGFLRQAKLYYDGDLFYDAIDEHRRLDVGFKIAIGQELDFGKFVVGYGLRSDIGVSNIFKGNTTVTAQENKTNVIHLGGYMTIGYKF